ncbi:hypothetical protein [Tengunoibacter tsumagoiensis]|uniref:Uncharacterized protein n=1 Tax=Tengunoibacter tsumagoiensis TaxID=2014871 RepID=A0A401ZV58_9CHLR|nr:hypothetical protein [Tengunoibacter tsumagoiensis]GCE10676.1 hypothetical protein KTT_05350 [Tengunoibacter tsumagoiensis]
MNHFVQGILTVIDEAYLCEPDFLLANGETIRTLFVDLRPDAENEEEENPVSALLENHQWYELLLIVQLELGRNKKVMYSPEVPFGKKWELKASSNGSASKSVLQGIILDLNWDASSQSYLAVAGPSVDNQSFVLIETPVGKMVLSQKALEKRLGEQAKNLVPGGYLEWEPARLDILAVIAKRSPQSDALASEEADDLPDKPLYRGFDPA